MNREPLPSFSVKPPSDHDRPAIDSRLIAPCAWCGLIAEGRYAAVVDGQVLPLCNVHGQEALPGFAEIAALVRAREEQIPGGTIALVERYGDKAGAT